MAAGSNEGRPSIYLERMGVRSDGDEGQDLLARTGSRKMLPVEFARLTQTSLTTQAGPSTSEPQPDDESEDLREDGKAGSSRPGDTDW